jgi:hypothetical protein
MYFMAAMKCGFSPSIRWLTCVHESILILHTVQRPHGLWPPESKNWRSTTKTPKSLRWEHLIEKLFTPHPRANCRPSDLALNIVCLFKHFPFLEIMFLRQLKSCFGWNNSTILRALISAQERCMIKPDETVLLYLPGQESSPQAQGLRPVRERALWPGAMSEWNWSELLNWTELSWIEMNWAELWAELNRAEMSWTELSWNELKWTGLHNALNQN